jgi:uncharacterized phiE125 gp8 family phage protein
MDDLILLTPPTVEPVTLAELKLQCGFSPMEDQDHVQSDMLAQRLRRNLATARSRIESMTRRVFITQTWQMNLDGFPGIDMRYNNPWERHAILLPKQPFQSIVSVQYVDITGTVVPLVQDTSYGNNLLGEYAYQLDPGSSGQPARIAPAWFVPWPLTRRVQAAVQITFTAGYGETGTLLPPELYQAILCLAHSYYDPSFYKDIETLVANLIGPYINRIS